MTGTRLADAITTHMGQIVPGLPTDGDNPLLLAYHRYPAVRRLVQASTTDTVEDLRTNRPTATLVDRILRHLRTGA